MTCKEIDNLLPAYEEDLLTPEEKKGVETHLAACERCRRSLADLRRAQELVRGLGEVEPPPFFEERIMSRVRQEAGRKRGLLRRLFYPLHIKIPIQALATVLVAVLAFHLYQQGEPEMKRVAPLPIPLAESAKEPAAAESPGAAGAPEAVAPARPPAGDLPGATEQRFAAPPPEGGGRREKTADSAAVREERPADVIREERRAPETPPPERMAKTAESGSRGVGQGGGGDGQREGGRSEAPGRAALRQETGKAPAGPAPERQAKAEMADAGIAAGEGRPMPAAPAPGRDGRFRGDRAIHGRADDPGRGCPLGHAGGRETPGGGQCPDHRTAAPRRGGVPQGRNGRRTRRSPPRAARGDRPGECGKGAPGPTEGTVTVGITIERRP